MTRAASTLLVALVVLALGGVVEPAGFTGERSEAVVTLSSPPLGLAPGSAARIADEQRIFRRELAEHLPEARVRWRYRRVANGFAVDLPTSQIARLHTLPGVTDVAVATEYGTQLTATPGQIGAPAVWGRDLSTAGQGMRIGIIDSGVDQQHPFFEPSGYTMPVGFPKGQRAFTTAKVIVARSFPPPNASSADRAPFHPTDDSHGTYVAGIAAGNAETPTGQGRVVSGVAPRAFIGNYKVFVQTKSGLSPNANSPAIVAAIEAAVADGMDVINFSGGQPELEPRRDVVARALDVAAAAGVVPVVAAGNDYTEVGAGSVSSPATSANAIAVGAVDIGGTPAEASHAYFSSVGPTTMSHRLKPDVAAPGVGVLSSVPDGWSSASGTSAAAPHVAGAAALLGQRHPEWTVSQIRSALVQTGRDALNDDGDPAVPQLQGGGLVSLVEADRPLLFAEPSAVSFGLVGRATTTSGSIQLADAGAGTGTWQVVEHRLSGSTAAARLLLPRTVDVPGVLTYDLTTSSTAPESDVSGFVELRRGTDVRRVPFWGRLTVAALGGHRALALARAGVYRGTTRGRPALVTSYRYPENPRGVGVTTVLRGPELVYRVRLGAPAANFGVVVTQRAPGVRVEPRVVVGLDESRLTGYAGLPLAHNPYLEGGFQTPVPAAGALLPAPGEYAVVFDSATRTGAGRFTFRYWVNDVKPPTLLLRARTVVRGDPLRVTATDGGSGVYRDSIRARIDGATVAATLHGNVVRIPTAGLPPGRHRLELRVSDYQETKNTENVARILPNTRTLTATITVR